LQNSSQSVYDDRHEQAEMPSMRASVVSAHAEPPQAVSELQTAEMGSETTVATPAEGGMIPLAEADGH